LKEKKDFLNFIRELSTALSGKNDLQEIAWIITQKIIGRYKFDDCVIFIIKHGFLYQLADYKPKSNEVKGIFESIRIKLGQGIVGTVAVTGVAEIIKDNTKDVRYIVDDDLRLSELTVPIIADKEIVGIIDSEHSERDFYTKEHLEEISTIANLVSLPIKSAIK